MATNLLLRRGTAAEAAAYIGGEGELFVDLDNNQVYVHDGVTAGGTIVTGIDLASFSIGTEGTASGDGSISYNNTTGVFTYTPPDLSGYTLSSSLSTVATSGSYNDLSDLPSLFSGSYNDLTDVPAIPADLSDLTDTTNLLFSRDYNDLSNLPTIPSVLTDLSISDGTNGQILTTDGAGNFSFTTVGGISNTLDGLTDVTITSVADGEVLAYDSGTSSWVNTAGVDLSAISQSIIPDTDVAYDLGSATNKFRDLYLSGSTIYLGNTSITTNAGNLILPVGTTMDDGIGGFVSYLTNITGEQLGDLSNVNINSPVNNEVLVYAGNWYNSFLTTGNLQDFDVANANTGEVLRWNGIAWANDVLSYSDLSNTPTLFSGSYNDLSDQPTLYSDSDTASYLSTNGYDTATNIIASITDSAPTTLDTLNELAAALGDDPNFATTVTNSIATKASLSGATFTGDVALQGLTTVGRITEVVNNKTGATGVVAHDFATGSIFYHTSLAANFTANITNVPTTNDRTIGVALVLNQGGTAYIPTALQIDGSSVTIKWADASVPSGNANQVDVVSFTLIRTGSAWVALGVLNTFG